MPTFLLGTAIGLIPNTAVLAFLGDDAVRLATRAPLVLAAVFGAGGMLVWFVRRRRDSGAELQPSGTHPGSASESGSGPPA